MANKTVSELELSLRDKLAIDRTRLANQRTFMAYVRTSVYLVIVGLAILELKEFQSLRWLVGAFFGLGLVVFSIGVFTYSRVKKRIGRLYKE